ncbi:hypothetical protein [Sulfuritalea hydrogenivorans]|uniref:Uncharacterized protein n=1 Tax=Sulfuritalea hydrogenivorans sk43H TaxID=1223802 RepID=W0SB30_9PROT|nr:hypothetical protein [Sulfuritalea hydrogenivorans]MDK9715192.1 hypothetical protein [Sulfuritalea sp.]BAO28221.1 hypothetical protein SUTH_00407 [Sulfuritalea hydrogenivorans sk43H]
MARIALENGGDSARPFCATGAKVWWIFAAIAGAQAGAWFMATRAKPAWVKRFYGGLLLAVAAKLIWDVMH